MQLHSSLLKNSWELIKELAEIGGTVASEHPADPGRSPYPSSYATEYVMNLVALLGLVLVTFPQCMWGAAVQKLTTVAANFVTEPFKALDRPCTHKKHDNMTGYDPVDRHYRSRRHQAYPPPLCEQLAICFVESLLAAGPREDRSMDDFKKALVAPIEEPSLGERVPCPEVGSCWDPLPRWTETARWRFRDVEHNNILEGRAAVGAATMAASRDDSIGKRILMISDSQVVVGVMSKGRSSVRALNRLARRVGALTLGMGIRFYWRYIRTHRNHADAPSRGRPWGTGGSDDQDTARIGAAWNALPDDFFRQAQG